MATFHPFPRLPYELRAKVWALAAEPREVPIRAKYEHDDRFEEILYLISPTPVPAVLHTCRESRKESQYEKMFYFQETEPRYVWVNFDLDMLAVGRAFLDHVVHNKSRVRRFKFEYEYEDDEWDFEDYEESWFPNLVECHVVVGDMSGCTRFWNEDYWLSKQEDFVFIDKKTGKRMNVCELGDMVERLLVQRLGLIGMLAIRD
ncbi:hypothetical protein H634G_10546 [Metarhizium anisopliae BRIP 53293]|uniref:2EXR domain-containing protein n=1 Tax=Metarhizium anisopliae BRIP 53293 TaxID=1291518 RepID=A0A0D9NJP6_METAN|nr:hypothetical protein H634G_10546 [Metarhizium anisopliae BRIP 53293]KJK90010.1 hypothetical protein H633G_06124 [Metarhizium anisopliae BRIP 53284]